MSRKRYPGGCSVVCVALLCIVVLAVEPVRADEGDVVWTSWYLDRSLSASTAVRELAASPDGRHVVVTGQVGGDWTTVDYDAEFGSKRWVARFEGGWADASPGNVITSPDSRRVFVTGSSHGTWPDPQDVLTVSYEAETGALLWAARYRAPWRGALASWPFALAMAPDGSRVYVSAACHCPDNPGSVTIAYDAPTGAQLWTAPRSDDARSVIFPTADGSRVLVTGSNYDGTGHSLSTLFAYDARTGDTLWESTECGQLDSIVGSPDGSVLFTTGFLWDGGVGQHGWYVTTACEVRGGTALWQVRYVREPYLNIASSNSDSTSIAIAPNGSRLFVSGFDGEAWAVVSYDASSGTQDWAAHYSHGEAHAMAVSPDSTHLYVSGRERLPPEWTTEDKTVVAFDADTGDQEWFARYGDTSHCRYRNIGGSDIAVAPDGQLVYTTGTCAGFFTIAYDTTACNESGPVSSVLSSAEPGDPLVDAAVHQVNCDVLVPQGL